MEMLEAMKACSPGGYVARSVYPGRRYFKDKKGIFPEAAAVDYIDFIATDWEPHLPKFQNRKDG